MATQWLSKVVFITGSSQGIGAATAVKYAKLGAKVALHGRNVERLNQVAKQCVAAGLKEDRVAIITGDITKEADIRRGFQEVIDKHGDINILVNNAGSSLFIPAMSVTMDFIDVQMWEHCKAPLLLSQLAYPYLKKNKGNIVNISSMLGTAPSATLTGYCSAKAAQELMSKCLSLEWATDGIRVNTVKPGWIRTDIIGTALQDNVAGQAMFDQIDATIPRGRVGTPEEIANVVAFVSSDEATYMTGASVDVNGALLHRVLPFEGAYQMAEDAKKQA